jgi:hypothetical protein
VGASDVVVLKCDYLLESRNTTNTDRVKGLIWRILQHPGGFTGEIIICDNTQDFGTDIDDADNNSDDTLQSVVDVVITYLAKGYPVGVTNWGWWWDVEVDEFSGGNSDCGFVYDSVYQVTYPKFISPVSGKCISMRHGVWDPIEQKYDSTALTVINMPALHSFDWSGSYAGIMNWLGMLSTAFLEETQSGLEELPAHAIDLVRPDLTIIDATWINGLFFGYDWIYETRVMVASTDPLAASWYATKYVLSPLARFPEQTDPDFVDGRYWALMTQWNNYLVGQRSLPWTMDSTAISIFDRHSEPVVSCCGLYTGGHTGNTNCDPAGNLDLVDITTLIDHVYLSKKPLCCPENGDINANGLGPDLADIARLIDAVYLSKKPTEPCQ